MAVCRVRSSTKRGCARGYFTARAAEQSLLKLGIDADPRRLAAAQKASGWTDNVGYANWEITPERIDRVPSADVIFFLTVYHHFVEHFGTKAAEAMPYTLGEKAETLVCEMPGDRLAGQSFEYRCRDTETDEVYAVTDYAEKDNRRVGNTGAIRARLDMRLPPGEYEVTASAEEYARSNPLRLTVSDDGTLDERPRVRLAGRGSDSGPATRQTTRTSTT